jgi:hypothetical protein
LEEIFELFHEGNHPNVLKGTGIGLALSKGIVNLHGGTIRAENNIDGGLTVTVKLKLDSGHYKQDKTSFVDLPKTPIANGKPINKLVPQPMNTSSPKDRQAPLVLLVEDHDELRSFIKVQLNEFYRVETARDGEEGCRKQSACFRI